MPFSLEAGRPISRFSKVYPSPIYKTCTQSLPSVPHRTALLLSRSAVCPLITHPATWQTDGELERVKSVLKRLVVNLPIETRQVSLPAGRRRLARTCRSASSRLSKPAPRMRPIGRLCEDIGACKGRILFSSGVAWTHAGRRLGIVTRVRVASAVALEPAARFFFPRSDDFAVACFFPPLSTSGPSVSFGTQRASPVNARMPACQSDGADLSPANLSCPEV